MKNPSVYAHLYTMYNMYIHSNKSVLYMYMYTTYIWHINIFFGFNNACQMYRDKIIGVDMIFGHAIDKVVVL